MTMETSGSNFPAALRAPDLAPVVVAPGPFATVELATEQAVENAAQIEERRWRALREALAAAGAPEAVLESIDPLIGDAHLEGNGFTIVANGDGVLLAEHHPGPPWREEARWASLPSLVPLLAHRQAAPPVVAVVADRRGADLVAFHPGTAEQTHYQAGGGEDPLARSQPGGWSQRRYQQRAENTWEHNAKDVAEEVTRLAEGMQARLVVAAGDVRALQLLQDALPQQWVDVLRVMDGGRSEDGSLERLTDEIRPFVVEVVDEDNARILEKFREERGQRDRAVEVAAATLAALAKAQVEVLLVSDDPDDDRSAWFGPEATAVALRREDLVGLGVDAPLEGRLVDVAVRATLGTGAGVRVVPPEQVPGEGLGALLRWSD
jgi:hypothetical protein